VAAPADLRINAADTTGPTSPCWDQARLKPGKHVFRVKARGRAGNPDAAPAVKHFKKRRVD